LLIAVAWLVPRPAPPAPRSASGADGAAAAEVEIDLRAAIEEEAAASHAVGAATAAMESDPLARAAVPSRSVAPGAAGHAPGAEPATTSGAEQGSGAGAPPAASAASEASGWALSPLRRSPVPSASAGVDLGIGRALAWQLLPNVNRRRDPGVERGEATAGGLREALDEYDHEIGLGRGGAVVSSAHAVASIDSAPITGKALFDVSVDSSGGVWVGVSSVDSDYAGWARVAGRLADDLRGKKLRVLPSARGLRFRVQVEARLAEYDGTKVPQGTRLEASPGEIDEEQKRFSKLPGVYLSGGGRVCQWAVGLIPVPTQPLTAGGWCDPTKLSVKPQRLVSARIVSEGRL
jgi:hypothetical protein